MMKFSGKLTRSAYWKSLGLLLISAVVILSATLVLLDLQNAEMPGASGLNQALAIILFCLLLISILYFVIMAIGIIIRRAHDTEHSMLWMIIGLFVPFGYVIIGFIPSKK